MLPVVFTSVYWLSITMKFRGTITFEHDYFTTLHYTGFFIVGALLAKHRTRLVGAARRIPKWVKWVTLCGAICAYSNAFWLPHYGAPQTGLWGLLLKKVLFQEWITATGVIVIIVISLSSEAMSGVLALPVLQFLGSISYSLYLFHALVLKVLVTLLSPIMPMSLVLLISVVCALLVATLSWRYIEIPCIDLGKLVTKQWRHKIPKSQTL
jgi:peptidoglycan/LPS O-acetylase OafA/YrhL